MRPQVTTLFFRPTRRSILLTGFAAFALTTPLTNQRVLAQATASDQKTVISAREAYAAAKSGAIILVDIRTPQEWKETGIGEGAVALDMREKDFVQSLVTLRDTYPEKPIALICRTGNRSGYVFGALHQQGFPGLVDVSEGMAGGRNGKGWIPQGLPTYAGVKSEIRPRLLAVMTP